MDFNKRGGLLLIVMLFAITLVIPTASALEIDNVYNYDSETREATFYNSFLWIKTTAIGKARLNTPLNVKVAPGYQKVAEFEIWSYGDYNDALKQFEFKDMKNGKVKINRDYDLKYLTYEDYVVNDYDNVYIGKGANGSIYNYEVVGQHIEQREKWNKITPADLKKNDRLTIGVFTDVKHGDFVDWIPTIYGEAVTEWATWTESLNVDLESYYKLDEASGVVLDSINNRNITNNGATPNIAGKIETAYSFDGSNDYFREVSNINPANTHSFFAWVYFDSLTSRTIISFGQFSGCDPGSINLGLNSNGKLSFWLSCESSTAYEGSTIIQTGQWYHLGYYYNPNGTLISYVNGVVEKNRIYDTGAFSNSAQHNDIGAEHSGGSLISFLDGKIDEIGLWDRQLTQPEITQLYNGGDGISYSVDTAPYITINSPSSINYTTEQSLVINFTASDNVGLSDVKLYVNGALNQTNASGINNSDYLFNLDLSDGIYTIYGEATDNDSQATNSSEIIIIIDSIAPNITLVDPADVVMWEEGLNLTLNWTVTDVRLDSCWIDYNGHDTYVDCGDNTTSFIYTGQNNLTFYSNDTFGNLASELSSWGSYLTLNNLDYDTMVYETGNTTLSVNISYDISVLGVNGILNYNGINYTTIKSVEAEGATFSKSFNIPAGRVGETNNFTWYFDITDGYIGAAELGEYNQTIEETYLGYCNGTYTTKGLNFTFWDENSGTAIDGGVNPVTYEGSYTYWIGDGSNTKNFSISDFNVTNSSYPICISPNSSIKTGLSLSYGAESYNSNSYYLAEASLTNNTNNIKLWLLPDTIGYKFYITAFYGITSLNGATITAAKYFDGEGVYKTTGIGKTDSGGKFTMYLDPDKPYIFYGVSEGASIGLVEKGAFCETAPCEMVLQFFEGTGGLLDGYNDIYAGDVVYQLYFNETTDLAHAIFSDVTGTASYFRFEVNRVSLNNSNLNICDQTLYTTSGAMSCNMSGLTGNYQATLVISRSPEKVIDFIQFIIGGLQDALGVTGLIVSLLFLIVIVFSGLRNPVIAVILIPVALVCLKLMDMLPISWLWVSSVAVLAFLIIGRLKT